jgi:hypothetical protein
MRCNAKPQREEKPPMTWKTTKTAKTCNTFPSVWAAILGCTGKGAAWRYTVGHFGRRDVEYACPICRAAKDRLDALQGPALQEALTALQAAAGVADYRLAEVIFEAGRPVLTGRIDKGLAAEAADYELRNWIAGGSVERAARAILVYGEDCTALVDSMRLTAAQRRALKVAYLAAKRTA